MYIQVCTHDILTQNLTFRICLLIHAIILLNFGQIGLDSGLLGPDKLEDNLIVGLLQGQIQDFFLCIYSLLFGDFYLFIFEVQYLQYNRDIAFWNW